MKSIEVKGTARTIAERSSEQARALKEIRKNGGVPCVLYGGNEVVQDVYKRQDYRIRNVRLARSFSSEPPV